MDQITVERIDRAVGATVGMAIGDALGAPAEFKARGTFPVITGYRDGGPFNLKAGQWTDDTIMGVHLAKSLIAQSGGIDPEDLMPRFISWLDDGAESPKNTCFDIGNSTRASLLDWKRGHRNFARDTQAEGNGSIMRMGPIISAWSNDVTSAIFNGIVQGRCTHNSRAAIDCTAIVACVGTELANGRDLPTALASCRENIELLDSRTKALVNATWMDKAPKDIGSSGHVISTLEAALFALHERDTFEGAVLYAANMGQDSDTIGAVTGILAGARHGLSDIPDHLVLNLWRGGDIVNLAWTLAKL